MTSSVHVPFHAPLLAPSVLGSPFAVAKSSLLIWSNPAKKEEKKEGGGGGGGEVSLGKPKRHY